MEACKTTVLLEAASAVCGAMPMPSPNTIAKEKNNDISLFLSFILTTSIYKILNDKKSINNKSKCIMRIPLF
ncbi:MAG: hypothetical protein ACLUO4_04990 [Christensenellales bacterium]